LNAAKTTINTDSFFNVFAAFSVRLGALCGSVLKQVSQ